MKISNKVSLLLIVSLLLFLTANVIQSYPNLLAVLSKSYKTLLILSVQLLIILFAIIWLFKKIIAGGYSLSTLKDWFNSFPIPTPAKWFVLVVVLGNLACVMAGKPSYPFYDVGMFRWTVKFGDRPKIMHKPKYFYYKNGEVKILDLRKEGIFFLADHFGLGYTHEFTFSAAFHNRAQKENFDFLSARLNDLGVDTLWVGVHYVNFETKKVWFDPDVCNAIKINEDKNLHYGPIYVPTYQLNKCNGN